MTRRLGGGKPAARRTTRTSQVEAPRGASRAALASDLYGLRPSAALAAPALSVLGLLIVGWFSIGLINGNVPFLPVSKAGPSGAPVGVDKTPTPPDTVVVVTPPPEDKLSGKLVYAKAGNIWVQDATSAHQITNFGRDAMPSFSPDGKWIIYIETLIDHKK